jgi:hypothetical protein
VREQIDELSIFASEVTMGTGSIVPRNFVLDLSAKKGIQECLDMLDHTKAWIPAICWLVTQTGPEDHETEREGPGFAAYEADQAPRNEVRNVDGIDLIFALTPQNRVFFDNKALHFERRRGFFLLDI